MKYSYIFVLTALLFIMPLRVFGQLSMKVDTIVTIDNDVIICENVKIGNVSVKYNLQGKSLEYSMGKAHIISINSNPIENYASTIVSKSGDVIKCNIKNMDGDFITYNEIGKKAEMTLSKNKIATLIAPDGTVESFAGTDNADYQANSSMPDGKSLSKLEYVSYSNRGKGHLYIMGGLEISAEEYAEMCNKLDARLWRQYRTGTGLRTAGTALLSVWGGTWVVATAFLVGALCSSDYYTGGSLLLAHAAFGAVGSASLIAGIPLYCVGKNMRNRSVKNFNQRLRSNNNRTATLNLGVTDAGVGLALSF